MQVNVCGQKGSGKSTLMTFFADWAWVNYIQIYANYKMEYEHTKINIDMLTNFELKQALVLLDEVYLLLSSEEHRTMFNRLMTYFFWQSRKRYVDVVISYQYNTSVDPKIRSGADLWIICESIPPLQRDADYFLWTLKVPRETTLSAFYDVDALETINEIVVPAELLDKCGVWDLFDTDELQPINEILQSKFQWGRDHAKR